MLYLTTVPLKCSKVLVVLEDRSSTIEESISHHPQREEVCCRVKSVCEGILWGQVVQGRLTDGLAVGIILLKGPEGLWMEMATKTKINANMWLTMPPWLIKFFDIRLFEYKNIRETTPTVQSPCKIPICNFRIYGVHLLLASGKICSGQYNYTSQVVDLGETHDYHKGKWETKMLW